MLPANPKGLFLKCPSLSYLLVISRVEARYNPMDTAINNGMCFQLQAEEFISLVKDLVAAESFEFLGDLDKNWRLLSGILVAGRGAWVG